MLSQSEMTQFADHVNCAVNEPEKIWIEVDDDELDIVVGGHHRICIDNKMNLIETGYFFEVPQLIREKIEETRRQNGE